MLIKVYQSLPSNIKSIAVSAYGIKIWMERNSKEAKPLYNLLMSCDNLGANEILDMQSKFFVEMARHSITNVPFYKSWATTNKVSPDDIQSIRDLNIFPVVTKAMIKENTNHFYASNIKKTFFMYTSGSTGNPLCVASDPISRSKHYAFFNSLRMKEIGELNYRRATLFGRTIIPAQSNRPPYWVMDYVNNNLLMSSYHINQSTIPKYLDKILSFKPKEIFSYPSSILPIAEYVIENNISIHVPLVMVTAENISNAQMSIIKTAFGGLVINQYGCTEMTHFCVKRDHNLKHESHPLHGFLEVSDGGQPKKSGAGNLIATGLINKSMPLIRYQLDDIVDLTECPKTGFQVVNSINGRSDDYILLKDGTKIGRLDPIFKGSSGYIATQIYQKSNYNVVIYIVPTENWSSETAKQILEEAKRRIGESINISIELRDQLSKSKNGKLKAVISEVNQNGK